MGSQPEAGSRLLLSQQIDGVSDNPSHGVPLQHTPEQHDNGQAASCSAIGCALCGEVPTAFPISQVAFSATRPDLTASLISVAVTPQLRPPALHA